MTTIDQKPYFAAFAAYSKINTQNWQRILGYFPGLSEAWNAGAGDFIKAGVSKEFVEGFFDFKKKTSPEAEFEKLEKHGVDIITILDEGYPKNLKEIFTPPVVLYVRGELKPEDELSIAIVGSRRATDYGRRATKEVAEGLAEAGITIVSGLALGLDAEAHKAAITKKSRTIAVLANGLDQIYPLTNKPIGDKILENGAIISEQPIGMPPLKQNFPARNRIISGLSLGMLVTEAGDKSGTLYTANFALEQNRLIYAIPGPIYNPLAHGPNNLIKMGAKPVTSAEDILEDLGIEAAPAKKALPETPDEVMIFEILENEAKHIDEITRLSEKTSGEISRILTMMEIKEKVKHLGGMVYTLKR